MKRPHHRSDWLGHWTDQKEMRQILSGLMHRRADSSEEEMASELNQTRHRLVILVLIAAYVFLINSTFTPEFSISPGGKMVLIYYGFYTPVALGLYFATRRWPGHYTETCGI